jgi:RimJ/RimL family protein N-acetyltransferase
MGLLPEYRGRGLGRRLAEAAVAAARERGMERIALEVFASNTRAIALYERLGFRHEGVLRRARKLDGRYDDNVLMALVDDSAR